MPKLLSTLPVGAVIKDTGTTYLYANIRQCLNSRAAAGAWYSAQHSADAAPTNANVWIRTKE